MLEYLTHTAKDNYDVTVRRAAYVFADRDYQLQVLNVLRDHRNQTVHASASTEEIETYLYQLKSCVEALSSSTLEADMDLRHCRTHPVS